MRAEDSKVLRLSARARALSDVIRAIPLPPALQQRLDRLNVLRAVRGTTGIEGTEVSEDEVAAIMAAPEQQAVLKPDRSRDEAEVRNACLLMDEILSLLRDDPHTTVSEALICRFHRTLTADIPYEHNEPGVYRAYSVHAGDYRPPPTGDEVRWLMTSYVRWLNAGPAQHWDPIVTAIAAHFYLVSIHPFGDGNGRTSRAVESFLLAKAGVNARGFYSLANYYYVHRKEYIDHLERVQLRGERDLTPFISFALRGLVDELEGVHGEVLSFVRIMAFRDYAREQLLQNGKLGTRSGERQLAFLMDLVEETPVSLRDLRSGAHTLSRHYRRVTAKTLSRDVNALQQLNLILVRGDRLEAAIELMTPFAAQIPSPGTPEA